MRLSGFEPPRSCDRQPLKLVRLPIPPQPQFGAIFESYNLLRSSLPITKIWIRTINSLEASRAAPASVQAESAGPDRP